MDAMTDRRACSAGRRRWLVAATIGLGAVGLAVRRWQRAWLATEPELDATLPGDDHVEDPSSQVTRAITIDARTEEIWPWIVQLGAERGGFYSYDWLENLCGLGIHSADEIVPAWQTRAPGDLVAANRRGTGGWYVVELRPDDTLAMKVANLDQARPLQRDEGIGWEFLWTFALRRTGDGRTRLLVREKVAFGRCAHAMVHGADGARELRDDPQDAARDQATGRGTAPSSAESLGPDRLIQLDPPAEATPARTADPSDCRRCLAVPGPRRPRAG